MTTEEIKAYIIDAATRAGIDPGIPLAIAKHESGFNPNATYRNKNGTTDWGVMQLNDTTVQTLGVSNPLNPTENIDAALRLLKMHLDRYNGDTDKALWAYASGAGTVAKGGTPNSIATEFIAYVNRMKDSFGFGGPISDTEVEVAEVTPFSLNNAFDLSNENGEANVWLVAGVALLGLLVIWKLS